MSALPPLFSILSRSGIEFKGTRYDRVTVRWFVDGREPGFDDWRSYYLPAVEIPQSAEQDARAVVEQMFTDDEAGRVCAALRRAINCSDIRAESVRQLAQLHQPYSSVQPGGQIGVVSLSEFPAALPALSAPAPLSVRGLFNIGPRYAGPRADG